MSTLRAGGWLERCPTGLIRCWRTSLTQAGRLPACNCPTLPYQPASPCMEVPPSRQPTACALLQHATQQVSVPGAAPACAGHAMFAHHGWLGRREDAVPFAVKVQVGPLRGCNLSCSGICCSHLMHQLQAMALDGGSGSGRRGQWRELAAGSGRRRLKLHLTFGTGQPALPSAKRSASAG